MPRYTDGVKWFDCVECGGLHFAVSVGGEIALVELFDDPMVINPVDDDVVGRGEKTVLQAMELESESTIYDESTDTWLHFFDVDLEDSPAAFRAFVSGRWISSVTRFS